MRFDGEQVTYWDMNCMKCSDISIAKYQVITMHNFKCIVP